MLFDRELLRLFVAVQGTFASVSCNAMNAWILAAL